MALVRLLIVRHALAVPQGSRGLSDADRPLAPEGERRFRAAARTIARLERPPHVLLTSPLVRARQTAQLLADAWGIEPTPEPILASGNVDAVVALLERHARDVAIALVGHEPTVSSLVIELLGVLSSDAMAFGVGTAALLEVTTPMRRGGRLVWYLPADLAAALAGEGADGAQ